MFTVWMTVAEAGWGRAASKVVSSAETEEAECVGECAMNAEAETKGLISASNTM
jgi:hypothetical protein